MSGYMNNLKPVVIVILRYSINLSMCEEVALRQVHYILGHYDIVYVSPEKQHFTTFTLHNPDSGP